MTNNLGPCPFCGNEAEFISGLSKNGYDRVFCGECFAEVEGNSKVNAIAKWNTRASVKVKKLIWRNGHAHGVGHHYSIRGDALYRNEFSGKTGLMVGDTPDLEAAAQADYERRIRSALE